ncbi:MAG: lipocalin family protein [Rudaea sp.]
MRQRRILTILRRLAPSLLLAACATGSGGSPPLEPHARIDLPRYMGAWYVIANIPYFGERGNVASRDVYTLNAKGDVDTSYVYRKSFDAPEKSLSSVGVVQPDSGEASWIVRFFWLLRADYLILDVAPDYSWALIGQPSRKLGWVFSRSPQMSDALYQSLLRKFVAFGYRETDFRRVAQTRDQLGLPGFQ